MKAINLIIIVAIAFFMSNCNKENTDMTVVDLGIYISFIDNNGTDLLNPNNDVSYKENEIKVFHLLNGKKELFYKSNLDHPNGFFIVHDEKISNYYYLGVGVNDYDNGSTANPYEAITLLELSENVTDTITCKIEKGENSLLTRQVTYNGKVVWDWDDNTERRITIKK